MSEDTAADRARARLGLPPLTPADTAAAQTALLTRLAASSDRLPTREALHWEVQTLAQIVLDLRARLTALEDRP